MHNDVAGNYLMGVIVVLVMADWLQLSVVMPESMNRCQQLNTYTVAAPMICFWVVKGVDDEDDEGGGGGGGDKDS